MTERSLNSTYGSTTTIATEFGDDDEEEVYPGQGVWLAKKGEGLGKLVSCLYVWS
jgi:hypothetical protein